VTQGTVRWQEDGRGTPGALVISLDFELHWGVRDVYPATGSYTKSLLGARRAIPRLLDLFVEYGVKATWATVGFLFAESRDELEAFRPARLPRYANARLDPYVEPVGSDEADDPLHYAPDLIRRIHETPGQEIGSHTYSHYYCLEDGSDAESFRQDLHSAVAIAQARGIQLQSIVLPRNQWNPHYAPILVEAGIKCYRGNQPGWMYEAESVATEGQLKRLARLADSHLPITRWDGTHWQNLACAREPWNVPATSFLSPAVSGTPRPNFVGMRRIREALTGAAQSGRIFHLWWHPHNFGTRTERNLAALRMILEHFGRLRGEHGMQSLTMLEAAELAEQMSARDQKLGD
jgi:peptidoglycan/xylan/chitin deacetylase (PgdA/CDA1 family)